jgi:hypothetical protein
MSGSPAHGKSRRWLLTVPTGAEPLAAALGLADLFGGVRRDELGGEEVRCAGQAEVARSRVTRNDSDRVRGCDDEAT